MSQSLEPLIGFHINALADLDEFDTRREDLSRSLATLRFAQALERKLALSSDHPLPPQVVAVGPTQAGKSTLVNLLLGLNQAGVSSQAGYTVHCQAFATDNQEHDWLTSFFFESSQVDQQSLQRGVLNEYSCSGVAGMLDASISQSLPDALYWDTPDFDSVTQSQYRSPVLQSMALADLLLMVVSKEKYADKSVWDVMKLLLIAGKRVVLVINKTPYQVRDDLRASVQSKLQVLEEQISGSHRPVIHFVNEAQDPLAELPGAADITALRGVINEQLRSESVQVQHQALSATVNGYWHRWTASLTRRHDHQQHWRQQIDEACESLLNTYDNEYLENKKQDETLRLAVAELLVLLEVPGLAEPLTRIRNIVTWPVRKVIQTASQMEPGGISARKDTRSEEQRLLESMYEHVITDLSRRVETERQQEADGQVWWHTLQHELSASRAALEKGWRNEQDNYQTLLKVETERAARSLYTKLEEQPATLNSLRAARVGADAAAVVLAVKSGGLGAADLVIAPAVLSLTTMLTESALGQYMKKVQQDLKRYQKKSVTSLVNRKLKMKLQALPASGTSDISAEQLARLAKHYDLDNA
ncbi:MAG: GTPase domain-containing protein [Pseudomonadota bacterium]